MYRQLLLTLDGSAAAEKALSHAVALTQAFGAELQLLSVVPLVPGEGPAEVGAIAHAAREMDEMGDYLHNVRTQLAGEGITCEISVLRGEVAAEILRHAEEIDADLVVMSTHGRSGLGRWVYGSVADRVLRHAEVPILLIRATE